MNRRIKLIFRADAPPVAILPLDPSYIRDPYSAVLEKISSIGKLPSYLWLAFHDADLPNEISIMVGTDENFMRKYLPANCRSSNIQIYIP